MQTRILPMLKLADLSRLLRLPLALMVALTALTGALATGMPASGAMLRGLTWGIFLLAAASSVLNQVLERVSDSLMQRTCRRPLASGQLSPGAGMAIGLLLASGGVTILAASAGTLPALLGLAALTWYLAAYTPLKRLSSLAVLAGTPCGALPPIIGWLAAGGTISDPQPLALALLMILWQVPHYWMLALPDRRELQATGFRVLPDGLSDHRLLLLSHRWILALCAASLLLPALRMIETPLLQWLVTGLAAALALGSTWLLARSPFPQKTARRLRIGLHLYLALLIICLLVQWALTAISH